MSTVIVAKELLEAALDKLRETRADVAVSDTVLNGYLAVIRQQAETIRRLGLICDAQDGIIQKLRLQNGGNRV